MLQYYVGWGVVCLGGDIRVGVVPFIVWARPEHLTTSPRKIAPDSSHAEHMVTVCLAWHTTHLS